MAKWERELKFMDIQKSRRSSSISICSEVTSCGHASRAVGVSKSRDPRTGADLEYSGQGGGRGAGRMASRPSSAATSTGAVSLHLDIIWPDKSNVCGFAPQDGREERKAKLRRALLQWHPDKWQGVLQTMRMEGKERESLRLLERLSQVTRRVLVEAAKQRQHTKQNHI